MRRQRRWRDVATRSVLDAAKATLIGVICFGLLVGVSTQFRAIRVQAPWAVDPYDAVASLAMMMVPIVAVITGLRCVRWRREVAYPVFALVEILRGCGVALVAIVATDVAYVAAVIRVGFPSDTQWRPLLLGLLLVSTASVACPSATDRATAASRIRMRTFLNCSSRSRHGAIPCAASSSFGPYSASRRAATRSLRPELEDVSSRVSTSASSLACQAPALAVAAVSGAGVCARARFARTPALMRR
jgi:hypothetical protein